MQDDKIVALYWRREELAIRETEEKYGSYLFRIAANILSDPEDSKESVNDTYFKAWNSIPPHRPAVLRTYLAKITRQVSIDRFRTHRREKRKGSEYALSLSELEECVSGGDTTWQETELRVLAKAIGSYLRKLPPAARSIFVSRYYYMDPIREVAACYGMTESKVKSLLHRTRIGLKRYLEKEGLMG